MDSEQKSDSGQSSNGELLPISGTMTPIPDWPDTPPLTPKDSEQTHDDVLQNPLFDTQDSTGDRPIELATHSSGTPVSEAKLPASSSPPVSPGSLRRTPSSTDRDRALELLSRAEVLRSRTQLNGSRNTPSPTPPLSKTPASASPANSPRSKSLKPQDRQKLSTQLDHALQLLEEAKVVAAVTHAEVKGKGTHTKAKHYRHISAPQNRNANPLQRIREDGVSQTRTRQHSLTTLEALTGPFSHAVGKLDLLLAETGASNYWELLQILSYEDEGDLPSVVRSPDSVVDTETPIEVSSLIHEKRDHYLRTGARKLPKLQVFQLSKAEDLPWWFDPYIGVLTGYRVGFSRKLCFWSLFKLHNESVNMWTELWNIFFFLAIWIYEVFFDPAYVDWTVGARISIAFGILFCSTGRALFSFLAHMFHCQSPRAFFKWWGIDYLSINVCVTGYNISLAYSIFYCNQTWYIVYMIYTFVLLAAVLPLALFVSSNFVRVGAMPAYILLTNWSLWFYTGSLWLFPSIDRTVDPEAAFNTALWWLLTLLTVGSGFILKLLGVPDRWCPGKLDFFGSSHQIWHVINWISACFGIYTLRFMYDYRRTHPCT